MRACSATILPSFLTSTLGDVCWRGGYVLAFWHSSLPVSALIKMLLLRNIPQLGTGLDPERHRPKPSWPPTCATGAGRARNSKQTGGGGGRVGGGGGSGGGGGISGGEEEVEEREVKSTSKRLQVGVLQGTEEMSRAWRPCGREGVQGLGVGVLAATLALLSLLSLFTPALAAIRVEDRAFWYAQARAQIRDNIEAHQVKGFAKNVILFVGDGMGVTSVTAARILRGQKAGQTGEEFSLAFEKFPHVAFAKTYNLDAQVGGSSACATALMCGVKSNVNTVGLDFRGRFEDCASSYTARVSSLIDWAQKKGRSTGIVTNTRLTHSTPSALYAHSASRYWEDDSKVTSSSRQACKDIARQLVEDEPGKNINVLLGGGRRHWLPEGEFDAEERNQQGRRKDGRNLIDVWIQDKKSRDLQAEYVWSKAQFDNVDPRYTDYLLGLFGYSHLDFEEDRNKSPSGDPSISEMTLKALQILRKNPHGFFLMVEGGRIDHAHHHNNARRALEEIAALEEAVMAALSATSPAETLIVLTADHSHVFTFGGYNTPRGNPITGFDKDVSDLDQKPYTTLLYGNGPGYSHSTPTGRQDISGYNSKGINFVQQSAVPRKYETHGGEDVPVYATGPSSYLFSGTVEQTYVAHAIAYASCMGDDSVHCEKPPSDDACARGHTEGDHYGSALYPQPQAPLGVSSSDVKDTKRPKSQWTTWHSGATLTSSVAKGGWQFLLRLLLPLLLLRLFCP